MSGEYGNDFVTIIDDDGNEFELEHLDTAEYQGELYMAFVPADMDEEDDDFGLVILKMITQDSEEIFTTIDDDDELKSLYDIFIQRLSDDDSDELLDDVEN